MLLSLGELLLLLLVQLLGLCTLPICLTFCCSLLRCSILL
jgi:hypothetical protein